MDTVILQAEGSLLNYSITEMLINTIAATAIGFILALVYRHTHKGLSYSQSFTQTIIFIAVIVAIVMMVIGGSLSRAFALVGALSIIRFRTVVKDTKDLSYVFGALALGMAAGTGNYSLAAIGTVLVSFLAYILNSSNFGSVYKSEFILRFRFTQSNDSSGYLTVMKECCRRSSLLHIEPSVDSETIMHTYDIALREEIDESTFITRLSQVDGVSEVVLIASKNDIDY